MGASTHSTFEMRKYGIASRTRVPWRRSSHSTQMIGGMPDTWGRGTGDTDRQRGEVREMRRAQPNWFYRRQWYHWRAVCIERCKHGSGRDGWNRTRILESDKSSIPQYLAGRLLYNILKLVLKERTVGQTATCGSTRATLGERRPLRKSRKTLVQVASLNQEPPSF